MAGYDPRSPGQTRPAPGHPRYAGAPHPGRRGVARLRHRPADPAPLRRPARGPPGLPLSLAAPAGEPGALEGRMAHRAVGTGGPGVSGHRPGAPAARTPAAAVGAAGP